MVRLVQPVPGWAELVDLGFAEVRACATEAPQVTRRLLAGLDDLLLLVPPERRAPLLRHREVLRQAVERTAPTPAGRGSRPAAGPAGHRLTGPVRPPGGRARRAGCPPAAWFARRAGSPPRLRLRHEVVVREVPRQPLLAGPRVTARTSSSPPTKAPRQDAPCPPNSSSRSPAGARRRDADLERADLRREPVVRRRVVRAQAIEATSAPLEAFISASSSASVVDQHDGVDRAEGFGVAQWRWTAGGSSRATGGR